MSVKNVSFILDGHYTIILFSCLVGLAYCWAIRAVIQGTGVKGGPLHDTTKVVFFLFTFFYLIIFDPFDYFLGIYFINEKRYTKGIIT